jgi:hypothetical protein
MGLHSLAFHAGPRTFPFVTPHFSPSQHFQVSIPYVNILILHCFTPVAQPVLRDAMCMQRAVLPSALSAMSRSKLISEHRKERDGYIRHARRTINIYNCKQMRDEFVHHDDHLFIQ